jgi:DNA polymerase-3 subunit epsilon
MKIFWFDTETSGTNPKAHAILQLAFTLEIDGAVEQEGVLYANSGGKEITDRALEINGFTRKQIADWPPQEHMYKTLSKLFDTTVDKYDRDDKLIAGGYNVDFDLRFLRQLWFENGDKYFGSYFPFGTIDPAALFRYAQAYGITGEQQPMIKLTLVDLATYFGIPTDEAHDAAFDVELSREVTRRLHLLFEAFFSGD